MCGEEVSRDQVGEDELLVPGSVTMAKVESCGEIFFCFRVVFL